jgi:hypothetical protein
MPDCSAWLSRLRVGPSCPLELSLRNRSDTPRHGRRCRTRDKLTPRNSGSKGDSGRKGVETIGELTLSEDRVVLG